MNEIRPHLDNRATDKVAPLRTAPLSEETDGAKPQALSGKGSPEMADRLMRGYAMSPFGGVSYGAALGAFQDWASRLAVSPMRFAELAIQAGENAAHIWSYMLSPPDRRATKAPFVPAPDDARFKDAAWQIAPYDIFCQSHLAAEDWWNEATRALPGVEAQHMRQVRFLGKFMLNALSPANFPWTNPKVAAEAMRTGGASLGRGALIAWHDAARLAHGQGFSSEREFHVGENLAVTPGAVVMRNELIELIQYAPTTKTVQREPVLIVPAWIMKYYILDLTAQSSLIRYLVDQGFTVFCISWKNPDTDDRNLGLDDYRKLGVMAALDAVGAIVPGEQIHGVGYCLGGTILAIAAAAMDRVNDTRLASLSLLTAQVDFTEAGELLMFVDESQLALLEDVMETRGYLDAKQMVATFFILRANEMFWSRLVDSYFLGRTRQLKALDTWLADATRMPACMHSQYLRWLFLENRFATGHLEVEGKIASLKDLRMPLFALGTERDHIAPWRSVHKIALLANAQTTFLLTGGGHNSGIVSPPSKPGTHYRMNVIESGADYPDPNEWLPQAEYHEGSWWPQWAHWLVARSSPQKVAPRAVGAPDGGFAPIEPAPGTYIYQR